MERGRLFREYMNGNLLKFLEKHSLGEVKSARSWLMCRKVDFLINKKRHFSEGLKQCGEMYEGKINLMIRMIDKFLENKIIGVGDGE